MTLSRFSHPPHQPDASARETLKPNAVARGPHQPDAKAREALKPDALARELRAHASPVRSGLALFEVTTRLDRVGTCLKNQNRVQKSQLLCHGRACPGRVLSAFNTAPRRQAPRWPQPSIRVLDTLLRESDL